MAYASVADIRMLRSDDGGNSFEITGGDNTDPLFRLNTVYDYDFAGIHTVFAVGGNFHDWPVSYKLIYPEAVTCVIFLIAAITS